MERKESFFLSIEKTGLKMEARDTRNTAALNVVLRLVGFRVTLCVADMTPSAYIHRHKILCTGILHCKEKNRNTLLKKCCWVFNFLLSLSVLELLPVDPVVIRRAFAVHCLQCLAGCSELA